MLSLGGNKGNTIRTFLHQKNIFNLYLLGMKYIEILMCYFLILNTQNRFYANKKEMIKPHNELAASQKIYIETAN